MNKQKPELFLYINNEQVKRKIRKTIHHPLPKAGYSEGRDQENCGSKPAQTNSL
jgi:hypothetical protein